MSQRLRDLFSIPALGYGVWAVWRRNFLYFRYSFIISFLWIFVDPIIYLAAIGYGLGSYIGQVGGQPYLEFFFPGFMMASAMMVCFYEGTYGCYTKLAQQGTFATILQTPVMAREIAMGEILWAATKGTMTASGVGLVALTQRIIPLEAFAPAVLVAFLTCLVFAGFAIYLAASAKSYDWFIYAQSGLFLPMYFFCGTYFPVEILPIEFQKLTLIFPLTHSVMAVRGLLDTHVGGLFAINIGVLVVLAYFVINLATSKFERKIVI